MKCEELNLHNSDNTSKVFPTYVINVVKRLDFINKNKIMLFFLNHLSIFYLSLHICNGNICDPLQENQAQRGTLRKKFFCTYRVVSVQILSSPSFIVVA